MTGSAARGIIIVALFSILGLLAVSSSNDYSQPQSASQFESLVIPAVELARSTGDGATITISTTGNLTTVALWAHRPIPGSTMESTPRSQFVTPATITLSSEPTSPAILFSSKGAASETSWGKGDGTLSEDGACPASGNLTLTFAHGATNEKHTLPCANPILIQ